MRLRKTIPWIDPLSLASGMPDSEDKWALLYSGMQYDFTGHYSILALRPSLEIKSSSFDELAAQLTSDKTKLENAWFGYLGYGLKDVLENLPKDTPAKMDLPDLWMVNYRLILLFDHVKQHIAIWSEAEDDLRYVPSPAKIEEGQVKITNLHSNMSKDMYLDNVGIIKEAINKGDLYQANLTRKFFAAINADAKPLNIFNKLCRISPSPYSAFLKFGDKFVISSSPERFLHVDENGMADTRPIKGSAPRFADEKKDAESRILLANSEKDRAENLMIVDLSRNDLSRSCRTGSVITQKLFEVTSYATVHHMASTVKGQKRHDKTTLQLVRGCFPPGSMTGAPKIKAIQLCTALEKIKRGIYAGGIGWFGGDGSTDLSVVIRTIIIDGNLAEFQVGGAIVADSAAEDEWQETMTKAKAIAMTLGINIEELALL